MTPPPADRASLRARRIAAARLASLFDHHATMVLGLCRLLLRDHHEAEDAAQQTFVSAYRSMLRGTEPRDAAPWLAAIARNECRARIRKRMRAPVPIEGELGEILPDPSDIVEETERRAEIAALTAAIADLPSRQREALALRDFLGLSYEEVASTLSVSVPVVESLLFRARRRLRDTVRTAPRYAASVAALPFAFKAAATRDASDLELAGAAGTAAAALVAILAKAISLPFGAKAATAVTVVALAAAGPQLPKMFDGEHGPRGGGQVAALAGPSDPGKPAPSARPADEKPDRGIGEPAAAPAGQPVAAAEAETEAPAAAGSVAVTVASETPEREEPAKRDENAPAQESPAEPIRDVVNAGESAGEQAPPAPAQPAEIPVIGVPEAAESQPPADIPIIGLPESVPETAPPATATSESGIEVPTDTVPPAPPENEEVPEPAETAPPADGETTATEPPAPTDAASGAGPVAP